MISIYSIQDELALWENIGKGDGFGISTGIGTQ